MCKVNDNIQEDAPNKGNLTVYVDFRQILVRKVDQSENTLTLNIQFDMFWMDGRIRTNFTHPNEVNVSYDRLKLKISKYLKNDKTVRASMTLWLPDFDFKDQLKRTPVSEEFVLTELCWLKSNPINPTVALIQMKLDMRVTVQCYFVYSNYPMDSQTCEFRFRSPIKSDIKYMMYKYKKFPPGQKTFTSEDFNMKIRFVGGAEKCDTDFGFEIEMKRILSSFVLKSYLPTIAIVLTSAISFIIPLSAIPGRVSLSVTLFLTLANLFATKTVGNT